MGVNPPAVGSKPQDVFWEAVGTWRLPTGCVYVGDSGMILIEQPLALSITPGVYDIDAKWLSYGWEKRIAVVRAQLQGTKPNRSRVTGKFDVYVASAGVIDASALDQWANADVDAFDDWQREFRKFKRAEIGFYPCKPIGSTMLYASAGFGQRGAYTVATLFEGPTRVGFELRFLEDDHGYMR